MNKLVEEIEKTISILVNMANNTDADKALKYTQAALNLSYRCKTNGCSIRHCANFQEHISH